MCEMLSSLHLYIALCQPLHDNTPTARNCETLPCIQAVVNGIASLGDPDDSRKARNLPAAVIPIERERLRLVEPDTLICVRFRRVKGRRRTAPAKA
jgi:hypothetical protein